MSVLPSSGTLAQILPISASHPTVPSLYSNMAYMNNAAAAASPAAGLPYMLSQAVAASNTGNSPTSMPTSANSAVTLLNVSNLLSQKDSRWLQLEVCREFQRNKCSRSDTECKFAHPAATVEVQNGRVTACYDSIKGRCNRDKPACKYFHPPQHLKDQLLINGRNHLALKNAIMQQMGYVSPPMIHNSVASMGSPYVNSLPPMSVYSPSAMMPQAYLQHGQMMQILAAPSADQATAAVVAAAAAAAAAAGQQVAAPPSASAVARQASMHAALLQQQQQQALVNQANAMGSYKSRSDKLEVCREFQRGACNRSESECRFAHPADSVTICDDGSVTVCMDHEKGRCTRDPCRYFHRPEHLRSGVLATTPTSSPVGLHSSSPGQIHTMQAGSHHQQQQHIPTSICVQPTTTMSEGIPNNVSAYKRAAAAAAAASVNMMEKSAAGLPVYQQLNMTTASDAIHHPLGGGNPTAATTVQSHPPSMYHQAILQQLQQQQQQSYLSATYANGAPVTIPRFP